MKLLLDEQRTRLLANGRFNATRRCEGKTEIDFMPVVKLFIPGKPYLWLLSEIDPDDRDLAYALCDTGIGSPVLAHVSLLELSLLRDIRQDERFKPRQSLGAYAEQASVLGHILT